MLQKTLRIFFLACNLKQTEKSLFQLFASLNSTHAESVPWGLKQVTYLIFSRAFLLTCDKTKLQYQAIVIKEIGRSNARVFFNVM